MRRLVGLLALVAALYAGPVAARTGASPLVVFAVPGQPTSSDFTVRARAAGGAWQEVPTTATTVDLDTKSTVSLAELDATGPVQVEVTRTHGTFQTARVRPAALGVDTAVSSDRHRATFTLPRPADVSFEADGDRLHNLQLFVGAPLAAPPADGRKRIAFGPGVHLLPGSDHVLHVGS